MLEFRASSAALHAPKAATVARSFGPIALLTLASGASAGFSFLTTDSPGGFIQACAGPLTPGANPGPGSDFAPVFASGVGADIQEQEFSGNSTVSRSAVYSGGSTSNSASGTVGLGFGQFIAENNAPNSSFFAQAVANGGWQDSFLISNPALTGQSGFMQFTVHVTGDLDASGFAGSAGFAVTGYKDDVQLLVNPLFDPGNSTPLSTDRQYGNWAIATDFSTLNLTVADTVTFAVPFTFGTPFDLGIYGRALAGMRSSSGVAGNSTASADFASTMTWGGIVDVYHGSTPGAEYELESGSGIDWRGPFVPAPGATAVLVLSGLGVARRRR